MTFGQELKSFWVPPAKTTQLPPEVGSKAPSSDSLPFSDADGRPTVVTFLRHCGCPFAEKTFKALRATAAHTPGIRFVAVSHSDEGSTNRWVAAVGGSDEIDVLVDADRDLFALWGLGISSFSHFLSPSGLWAVYRLGKDGKGIVRWGGPMQRAHDIPDFDEAVERLKAEQQSAA